MKQKSIYAFASKHYKVQLLETYFSKKHVGNFNSRHCYSACN